MIGHQVHSNVFPCLSDYSHSDCGFSLLESSKYICKCCDVGHRTFGCEIFSDEHALDFALHLSRLFRSALNRAFHSNTRVRLMLSSPNAYAIIVRVPIYFSKDFHKSWCCFFVGSISKSHQARFTTPNERTQNSSTFIQLRGIFGTDSQALLILSSAVASRNYNCCRSGFISPGNYGYPFVFRNQFKSIN
jgi:hypothetical protein